MQSLSNSVIFTEFKQNFLQYATETQKTSNNQNNLKKNITGGIRLPDSGYTTKLQPSKQYGTGTKTRNIDQCNKIERPVINSLT